MIDIKEHEELSVLNHSCAHLMAQAIKRLYPQAKFWVGPVISEGFYYDIDLGSDVIRMEDLEKIEKEMKKISKDGKRISREELTKEQALELFQDDPYKIDLISNMDEENTVISAYRQGEFIDLCRGPHVESVKALKHFKLLKVSGAYWKGDANNKMLQRVYGICFDSEERLAQHLQLLEDAKQRDHRKLGKEMDIFFTHELIGPGMPMWLPNGSTIKRILERYIQDKELSMGYQHVNTPAIGTVQLYKTSGHWDHYVDNMFPVMKMDQEELVLRPMNCPHHMLIYKNNFHSYRDLPLRIGELAHDYRYEASGAVVGLERVRCMCMNDAHIFVTPQQIESEFKKVVDLILEVYRDFGIKSYSFRLSLRDPQDKEKYFDDDAMWNMAETMLRKVLQDLQIEFVEEIGEAAFYGPKLDVQVKSAIGHEFTLSTCQLDFLLPGRFDLSYIDSDGSKKTPVVIHRAITSTSERFIAYILEETKGILPLWIAPRQIAILPVHVSNHLAYANQVHDKLRKLGFRVELDDRDEKLGYRVREAQMKKIPYQLVLGNEEQENHLVTVRKYGSQKTKTMSFDDFIELVTEEVNSKSLYQADQD